ncbi:hypothetical protein HYDPIDRAFT_82774, partial [Hydnomerulius pinastri MD-312]
VLVVDCLHTEYAPPAFIIHPIIQAVMMSTWKGGLHYESSHAHYVLQHFDALTTPRALHSLHLLSHLAFIGALAHYLLYPPHFHITLGRNEQTTREAFLTVMAATSLLVPWTMHTLSYILVFLALILTLPSVPLPGSLAFTSLHIALIVHVISLHLPDTPSIACFLRPRTNVPLATLMVQSTARIALPALLFFLPAFFFASFLVSASLGDTSFNLFKTSIVDPSPMDSRVAFFFLFVFISACGFSLTLMSFSVTQTCPLASAEPWDRYTPSVGLVARKSFYRAVVRYTGYTFFPPFNLIQLVTTVPSFCLAYLGYPQIAHTKMLEIALWRLSIGILGALAGGFWLWGLT